jgi:3-oxoacyl-[acyl-carrier protein] reductase
MILKDKVAVITGAARGIGKEIALKLAREGAKIVICDVNQEELKNAQEEIGKLGVEVMTAMVDVSSFQQVTEFINNVLDKFERIDILINNAGITRDKLLLRMEEKDWDSVLSINLKGAFNLIKAVSRPMLKQKGGIIVNMASIIGLMGNPGQANYAASKAGLIALTKTVAKELGSKGIRANAIAPGYIKTQMTDELSDAVKDAMLKMIPLGELGTTDDIANLALFLCSPQSRYITGQVIQVDGGMLM